MFLHNVLQQVSLQQGMRGCAAGLGLRCLLVSGRSSRLKHVLITFCIQDVCKRS